jgi:[ribosomal protein S18]-alanine N-acetyltransferase
MNNPPREPYIGRFRRMIDADLREILTIERRSYEYAWTEGIFRDCIRSGYHCRVLEIPHGLIQAYGVLSAAAGEAHLLNLCVRPELQGRGFSRRMLDHLLELARANAVQTVFLEVRPSNVRAIHLYDFAGFHEIGRRPGYYPAVRGREDALVMAREL